jgi:hypothetical protein
MMRHIIFILVFLASIAVTAQNKKTEPFSIIAFGDMPYFLPEDFKRFENLIQEVNNQTQAFNVHVGDIKSSKTLCTEEYYHKIYNYFGQFNKPLIYTPGDNEWTDCDGKAAGAYDPEERLDVLRKIFFKSNASFGKEKIDLTSQSENSAYSKFVENKRWDFNGVSFGTVHLVGTNNFFVPDSKNFNHEFYERDAANINWLNVIFDQAKKNNSAGVILFTQADMFSPTKPSSGFTHILRELKKLTIDFKKPVVLVHGDSHKFLIDKPFIDESSHRTISNFTRIQVFGEYDIHAVKIVINPTDSGLFHIEQLLVPDN